MNGDPRQVENSIMRLALQATEATIGQSGLNAVLRVAGLERLLAQPPANDDHLATPGRDYAALFAGMFNMYGEHSARGVFRRWGANFGKLGVNSRPTAKLLRPMLSLLPLTRRAHTLLEALAREADRARGAALHSLSEDDYAYTLTFADCLYCNDLRTAEPICLTIVGTIEAVLAWGTGRDFTVTETTCQARGDEVCTFVIDKRPLNV
ncbi:MAG: 4-vinyl reductase [Anaerolineae bacterium]